MEKPIGSDSIPATDSIEELARFWDEHDLTDFEDQLENVGQPVFERGRSSTVYIRLSAEDAQTLKRIAESEGLNEAAPASRWVRDRLRKSS